MTVRSVKLALIAILLVDLTAAILWLCWPTSPPPVSYAVKPLVLKSWTFTGPQPGSRLATVPAEAASEFCALHGKIRTNGIVRVSYGLIGRTAAADAFARAEAKWFPNSWSSLHAGCTIDRSSAAEAVVKICPRCRDAEQRWRKQHARRKA